MTWPFFLVQLKGHDSVTLVGPLHDSPVTPTEPTVFVDGGANFWAKGEKFPAISVGDGDSCAIAMDHLLPTEKDYSDLAYVLNELPTSVSRLRLLGFLGGRLDHSLANLGQIYQFLQARPGSRVEMERRGEIEVIGCNGDFEGEIRGIFSVLAPEPTHANIFGACRYPLDGPLALISSHGLSNEGHGRVTIRTGKPSFIFLNASV